MKNYKLIKQYYDISVAYWSEISYRIKESTSTGFFFFAAQLIGIAMCYFGQGMLDLIRGISGVIVLMILQIIATGIGTVAALLMKPISYTKAENVKPMVTSSFIRIRSDEYDST